MVIYILFMISLQVDVSVLNLNFLEREPEMEMVVVKEGYIHLMKHIPLVKRMLI